MRESNARQLGKEERKKPPLEICSFGGFFWMDKWASLKRNRIYKNLRHLRAKFLSKLLFS